MSDTPARDALVDLLANVAYAVDLTMENGFGYVYAQVEADALLANRPLVLAMMAEDHPFTDEELVAAGGDVRPKPTDGKPRFHSRLARWTGRAQRTDGTLVLFPRPVEGETPHAS